MAEEGTGTEPAGEDWKARYEEALAASRKWERRAKENSAAAEQLSRLSKDGKSAAERISEYEDRLGAIEREGARAKVAAKVAREKGVPAELLVGDDEEAMTSYADRLLEWGKPPSAPKVDNPGNFARDAGGGDSELRGFARELLGKE